jgi:ferredoxin-NADP reductase
MRLRVTHREIDGDGVVVLDLADPAGTELPAWAPGAHLDLQLPGGMVRQYSLCGDPADRSVWRIGVLRDPDGRGGSMRVHEELHEGVSVEVGGPRNHFVLEEAPRYVFIAGGIGITPILPMIAAAEEAGAEWELHYGGRSRRSMAFLGRLEGDERVTIYPQDEVGLIDLDRILAGRTASGAAGGGADTTAGDKAGRTAGGAAGGAADTTTGDKAGRTGDGAAGGAAGTTTEGETGGHDGTLVYCCGPEPLIQAVEQRCAARTERFKTEKSGQKFDIELALSGLTLTVPEDKSVLEVVEEAGIPVLSSCREGTCGTCETPVLAGDVEHRDSLLTPEERAANDTMFICVSRATSPTLVLEL